MIYVLDVFEAYAMFVHCHPCNDTMLGAAVPQFHNQSVQSARSTTDISGSWAPTCHPLLKLFGRWGISCRATMMNKERCDSSQSESARQHDDDEESSQFYDGVNFGDSNVTSQQPLSVGKPAILLPES